MDARLASFLVDLSGLSDKDAEQLVFQKYVELYLDRGRPPRRIGIRKTHDGTNVKFGESRYDHAFYTFAESTSRKYAKDKFDRLRGERVAWIGPVVAGEIEGTECWIGPPKNGRRDVRSRAPNRFYIVPSERYNVWLEPTRDGGWWFSSAYVAGFGDIRRYCRIGRQIWAQKNIP